VMRHVGRTGAEPVELHTALFHGLELLLERLVGGASAGAEDADVSELTGIVVCRADGVAAAHREARDRAIVLHRDYAIPLFDERNDALQEALRIRALVRLRLAAAAADRRAGAACARSPTRRLLLRLHRRRRRRDDLLTRGSRTEAVALRHRLRCIA